MNVTRSVVKSNLWVLVCILCAYSQGSELVAVEQLSFDFCSLCSCMADVICMPVAILQLCGNYIKLRNYVFCLHLHTLFSPLLQNSSRPPHSHLIQLLKKLTSTKRKPLRRCVNFCVKYYVLILFLYVHWYP